MEHRLENYLGGENLENLSYYLLDCPSLATFMYPSSKEKQYPTMLSFKLLLSNTLRNFEFVYLKSEFAEYFTLLCHFHIFSL